MKSTQTHIAPHATRFASCGVRCDDGGLALGAYYDRPAVGRDEPSPAMAEQIAGAVDLYSRVRACGALAPCSRGVVVTDDDECYLSGHGEYEDRVFFGDIAVTRCAVLPFLRAARWLVEEGLPIRGAARVAKHLHGLGVSRDDDVEVRDDAVILPGYVADDGNNEVTYDYAASSREAAQMYVDDGDWGDDEESFSIRVDVWRVAVRWDGGGVVEERVDEDSHLVVVHPDEPTCAAAEDGEHAWSDDFSLVGGIKENPGVWLTGGLGMRTVHVCALCGMARIEQSASQGVDTEHDHETTRYVPDHVSVDDLAKHHGDETPDNLRDDSDLARAIGEVVECGCQHCDETTRVRDGEADGEGWGTSDDGEWYCPDCLDYSCDEDGQPLCSAHDIPEISWGHIQTGGAGVSNWQTGTSADGRRWRREDHGGRNSTQWTAPVPIGVGVGHPDGEDEG